MNSSRSLRVVVLAMVFGLLGPNGAWAGADASADSALGTLRASVFVGRGRSIGSGGSCRWQPSWGDTALDEVQGDIQMSRVVGGIRQLGYERRCAGESTWRFFWIAPGTPGNLSRVARDELTRLVPSPVPASAPGFTEMFVGVDSWVWTKVWEPVSATAWVPTGNGLGRAWATATARPTRLVFTPGDGSAPVVCTGPGSKWTPDQGDDAVSDCMVRFEHSSLMAANGRSFTATMAIEWQTSWTGSGGVGGALAPITTTATFPVTVGEIQAVVVGG